MAGAAAGEVEGLDAVAFHSPDVLHTGRVHFVAVVDRRREASYEGVVAEAGLAGLVTPKRVVVVHNQHVVASGVGQVASEDLVVVIAVVVEVALVHRAMVCPRASFDSYVVAVVAIVVVVAGVAYRAVEDALDNPEHNWDDHRLVQHAEGASSQGFAADALDVVAEVD